MHKLSKPNFWDKYKKKKEISICPLLNVIREGLWLIVLLDNFVINDNFEFLLKVDINYP